MAKNYRPLDDPNDHKFMEDFYLQNNRLIMDKVKKYVSNVDDREDIMQIVAESLVADMDKTPQLLSGVADNTLRSRRKVSFLREIV